VSLIAGIVSVPRDYKGWTAALVLSSAIFGSAHYYQGLTGIINAGTIGLLIGILYLFTGRNLWAVILCHGLVDIIFFIIVYLNLDSKILN
jgi:membrane protease YdiL (CAAX protease family)